MCAHKKIIIEEWIVKAKEMKEIIVSNATQK